MRRAGDGADHDVVEGEAEFLLLLPDLFGKADIAQAAIFMDRSPGRDRIGFAALGLDVLDGLFPAPSDTDIEAFVDHLHVGAHDAAEHDVADAIVDRVLVRHPALLNQTALEADLCGDRGDHAGVVGLHAPDGNQRVGVRRDRVGNDVLELAQLVAAEGETGIAILPLGIELDLTAEMLRQTLEFFYVGRPECEGIPLELGQHGSSFR